MEWGKILYTEDAMYNVHGVRLTLKEYQTTSALSFKSSKMMMGDFNNMLICGDWTAIRYDISSLNRQTGETYPGSVMEFVNFKDYGDEMGTRVVEGWAGTVGADYQGLMSFLTEDEKSAQIAFMESVVTREIPQTEDLEEKYPVMHPTVANSNLAEAIKTAILEEFELWNQGYDAWADGAAKFYAADVVYHTDQATMNLEEYKESVREESGKAVTTRVYFENMLISGDWAAVHFRTRVQDKTSGKIEADNEMKFLHFVPEGDGVKVIECWVK